MNKNMGAQDRIIRMVIAVIVGTLYFTGSIPGTLGIILLILAIVFAITGFIGFCPLYRLFGISTCNIKGGKTTGRSNRYKS